MAYPLYQVPSAEVFPNLCEIPQHPETLWIRGSLPAPDTKLLTVVGSRAVSAYGKKVCESLIMGLKDYPISIVSGLALGTDALAHEVALKADLHTIAVPGSGITDDVLYPKSNQGLAEEILEHNGMLLTEFAPDFRATRWSFPRRNRIMAGLADAVLMIEAAEKSGTLITARLASEYNRELCVVPHPVGAAHGYGPHLFARLGATLVTEPAHILEALRIPAQ